MDLADIVHFRHNPARTQILGFRDLFCLLSISLADYCRTVEGPTFADLSPSENSCPMPTELTIRTSHLSKLQIRSSLNFQAEKNLYRIHPRQNFKIS